MCGAIAGNTRFIRQLADCVETTGSVNTKTAPRRSKKRPKFARPARCAFAPLKARTIAVKRASNVSAARLKNRLLKTNELEAKIQEIETSAEFKKTRGTKTPVYISRLVGLR
jgi:hypothetical protein